MQKLSLNGKWVLYDAETEEKYIATVPGDINYDMYVNKNLPYIYRDENFKLYNFAEKDYYYEKEFELSEKLLGYESAIICFYGIDVFSEIYINGQYIGKTDDAFLGYKFNIKDHIVAGKNVLRVKMLSTMRYYNSADASKYEVLFAQNRLFIRKPQCHFGWDWAPKLVAYGIYRDVEIRFDNGKRIDNVSYITENDGNLRIFTNLENDKAYNDFSEDEELSYRIYNDGKEILNLKKRVREIRNCVNVFIPKVKLWWPNGYGEQNIYRLEVTLYSGGEAMSVVETNLAFRSIRLLEKAYSEDITSFAFEINGVKIFGKGSNWVPLDCLTGTITDEKYDKAVFLAKEANMNMLRVWGGGLYESDAFYDACDRYGIMVWQDSMLACSEIPDDDEFAKTLMRELKYNVIRIRNHPSLLCITGGNERIVKDKSKNEENGRIVNYYLRGVANALAPSVPYFYQSPHGYASSDNECNSGDCHKSAFDRTNGENIGEFRETLAAFETNFTSECTSLGPATEKTYRKMFSPEKLWPITEIWTYRHSRNPYGKFDIPFIDKIILFAERLYGKTENLKDFCKKGMEVHAKMLGAEIDFHRISKRNAGVMNWMFSDIWPTGNWSLIDYYLERKAAYYAAKRSFAPVRPVFAYVGEGSTQLTLSNNTKNEVVFDLVYGERYYVGGTVWSKKLLGIKAVATENLPIEQLKETREKGTYFFAEMQSGELKEETVYNPNIWDVPDCAPKYTYKINSKKLDNGETVTEIRFFAESYVKTVSIEYEYDDFVIYSDNYFDMQPNSVKTVTILSRKPLNIDKINISSFKEAN